MKRPTLTITVFALCTGCTSSEEECKKLQLEVHEGQEYYSANFAKKGAMEWKSFLTPLRSKAEKAVATCTAAELTTDIEKAKDSLGKLEEKQALVEKMLKVDAVHSDAGLWYKTYCGGDDRTGLDSGDETKPCCTSKQSLAQLEAGSCIEFTRELEELRRRAGRRCAHLAKDECSMIPPKDGRTFGFSHGGAKVFVYYSPHGVRSDDCSGMADAMLTLSGKTMAMNMDDDQKMCHVTPE